MTSAGNCSTSISGGTPTFSTTQPFYVRIGRLVAVIDPLSKIYFSLFLLLFKITLFKRYFNYLLQIV